MNEYDEPVYTGHLFSNGTEHEIWLSYNCEDCRFYKPEANTVDDGGCEIEIAVCLVGAGAPLPVRLGEIAGLIEYDADKGDWHRPWMKGSDGLPVPGFGRCRRRRTDDDPPDDDPPIPPPPNPDQLDLLDPRNVDQPARQAVAS